MQGSPNGSDSAHGPIESNTVSRNTDRSLYGLSGVFTVDADTTPPELESAAVTEVFSDFWLILVFGETLDVSSLPAADAFTVTVGGVEVGLSSRRFASNDLGLVLILDSPVRAGQEVLVSYAPPAANPIQDLAGNAAEAFTDFEAKNNIVEWSVTFDPSTIAEDGGVSTVTVSTGGATFDDDKSITLTPAGTAMESTDYTIGSKSLTLTAGDTEVTTTVTALADSVDDEPETVTLTAMLGADQIGETATLTITGIDPPGAPRNVAATAGTGKVRLTWQAPESEGGGAITHYEYQRKEGSGSFGGWTTAETVMFGTESHSAILVDATTLDDYDVKAETTYTYRVRAVNAGGGGAAAESGEATTGAAMTVKVEVAEPEVFEDQGPVRVVVVAELPATGPNTEKYELEFGLDFFTDTVTAVPFDDYTSLTRRLIFTPSDFEMEPGRWVAEKPFTVTLDDDDLFEPDETFEVVVKPLGSSLLRPKHPFVTIPGATDTVTVTILNDDHKPVIPTEEFEVLLGETDVELLPARDEDGDTLTWTLTGGADQNLFTLSTDGQLSLKVARMSLENPGDNNNDGVYELTVQVSDGHHTPATSGDITVRLIDVAEPPRRPGAPWVRALDGSTDALDVRWAEIEGDAVRSYDLRYREGSSGDWTNGPQDVTGNRATIRGLESGTSYQVQLRATNSKGDSDWSDPTTGYPATVYDIDGIYIYWTERQGSEKLHDDAADLGSSMLENACDTGESFRAIWLQPLESSDADEWEADVQTIEGTGTAQYTLRTAPELTGAVALDGFTIIGIRIRGRFGEDWSNWSRAVNLICVPTEDDSGSATGNSSTGSENATSNPLTGFELVDATAHLDAGAVENGATLTGIDPAKVYGFRADVASGAELKSVKLELSGPGPDDRVARTENYKPYSLRGDSDGHEHGAALPAGSYTLTATAYSEQDGGGSQLGTLSIEFTVTGGPLTARFLYEEPQGYHSGSGTTLTVRLSFSEAVSTTPEALRDHALEVTNATVEAVSRVDERSDLWEVRLTPESDATVTVAVSPAADCDAAGAVCTEDGRTLASGAGTAIPGPPPNSTATGAPTIGGDTEVGQVLSAGVTGIDDDNGLDNATFSYQWLRSDGGAYTDIQDATGSTYTLVADDEGKTIKVTVSFTDAEGNPETLTSDPTGEVEAKPNIRATGAPAIDGIARVGETMTADTSGIDDDDGLDTAVFTYQWVRNDGGTDTEITGATGSSYVLTGADEGKTIKVTVSFTDAEGNHETLTSDPTGEVEAKPNTLATGAPAIDGIARVGETLTADTSGIDDDDGLENAAFAYQWLRNDGNGDAEIQNAAGSSYTLVEADEGKTIKVTVSFTDAEGNHETLISDATGVVEARETVPGRPQDLAGDASAQDIKLTWSAPSGSAVTQYVVYRGELENGSMNGRPMTEYATIDAAGEAMEYTDADVKAGAEYRYRVAAVNSAGEGRKSGWLDITAKEPSP